MDLQMGDAVTFCAVYLNNGKENVRIETNGAGYIVSMSANKFYIIDMGIRNVTVYVDDITENFGKRRLSRRNF